GCGRRSGTRRRAPRSPAGPRTSEAPRSPAPSRSLPAGAPPVADHHISKGRCHRRHHPTWAGASLGSPFQVAGRPDRPPVGTVVMVVELSAGSYRAGRWPEAAFLGPSGVRDHYAVLASLIACSVARAVAAVASGSL